MACSDKVHESVVNNLMNILSINPYSIFLKSLMDVPDLSNFYIALKSDTGLDQRVYNLPTTSEVEAIWVEKEFNEISSSSHIRIYIRSNKSQILNYYYGFFDPQQYPLLLRYGQSGWHCAIKKITSLQKHLDNQLTVNMNIYQVFKIWALLIHILTWKLKI